MNLRFFSFHEVKQFASVVISYSTNSPILTEPGKQLITEVIQELTPYQQNTDENYAEEVIDVILELWQKLLEHNNLQSFVKNISYLNDLLAKIDLNTYTFTPHIINDLSKQIGAAMQKKLALINQHPSDYITKEILNHKQGAISIPVLFKVQEYYLNDRLELFEFITSSKEAHSHFNAYEQLIKSIKLNLNNRLSITLVIYLINKNDSIHKKSKIFLVNNIKANFKSWSLSFSISNLLTWLENQINKIPDNFFTETQCNQFDQYIKKRKGWYTQNEFIPFGAYTNKKPNLLSELAELEKILSHKKYISETPIYNRYSSQDKLFNAINNLNSILISLHKEIKQYKEAPGNQNKEELVSELSDKIYELYSQQEKDRSSIFQFTNKLYDLIKLYFNKNFTLSYDECIGGGRIETMLINAWESLKILLPDLKQEPVYHLLCQANPELPKMQLFENIFDNPKNNESNLQPR